MIMANNTLLHFHHEDSLVRSIDGVNPYIVGVDEVGYGAWAGSIVVAAVWINRQMISDDFLKELNDSKKLSPKKRNDLCQSFIEHPLWGSYALAHVPVRDIIQGLVLKHTLQAMVQAVYCLDGYLSAALPRPLGLDAGSWSEREKGASAYFLNTITGVVVDGQHSLPVHWAQKSCPGADGQSYSVALASIVAKVARDDNMRILHEENPQYSWDKNKGYGTQAHQQCISQYGLSQHHRPFYCKRAMGE
ncbi:MAG: ribonuclease HII [Alphaproteobacteria bacterium]|nr:ribonuclease HII [Alphaproteobacteria bacterium]